jgi:hypothetical protein
MYFEYLPVDMQLSGYSSFLQKIEDEKLKYFEMGDSFNLNMLDISIETVNSILLRGGMMVFVF